MKVHWGIRRENIMFYTDADVGVDQQRKDNAKQRILIINNDNYVYRFKEIWILSLRKMKQMILLTSYCCYKSVINERLIQYTIQNCNNSIHPQILSKLVHNLTQSTWQLRLDCAI